MGCDLHKKDDQIMRIYDSKYKQFIGDEEIYDYKTEEAAKHLKFALEYYISAVKNSDMYCRSGFQDKDGNVDMKVYHKNYRIIEDIMKEIEDRVVNIRNTQFEIEYLQQKKEVGA